MPEELVVPINCLRTVYCVSDAPELLSVNRVLTTAFGSFSNALFFSGSLSLGIKFVSIIIPPLESSGSVNPSLALAPPTSVPFNVRLF